MRIAFIIHGRKKKKSAIEKSIEPYLQLGDTASYFETTHSSHGTTLARQCFPEVDVIVPIGGDGLFHECLNGWMQARIELSNDLIPPVMVPWPCGSGNDFARNYLWKDDAAHVMARVYGNKTQQVDVGCIVFADRQIIYFLNEMSIGLGPEVVKHVNELPPHWSGGIKFGLGIIKAFFTFKKKVIEVSWNENANHRDKTMAFVVANGKYFGSGLGIAPTALVDDGKLNLTIIGDVSLFDYLKQLGKLKSCKVIHHPEVKYDVSNDIVIHSSNAMESDGEWIGYGPAKISLIKQALWMR